MDTQNPPTSQPDPSVQIMPQQGNYGTAPTPPLAPLPRDDEPSFFKNKRILIIGGIILLLILGLGAYFMLNNKKQTLPEPATPTTKLPKVWLTQYFGKETCDDQNVCGDEADTDSDGLKNYDEFKAGTSPINSDTDSDGVADGDEVYIYKTEPTLKYTDRRDVVQQNNWTDGLQIKNGYDPLTPGLRFTEVRNKQIADDTSRLGLHEPTKTNLTPPATTPVMP